MIDTKNSRTGDEVKSKTKKETSTPDVEVLAVAGSAASAAPAEVIARAATEIRARAATRRVALCEREVQAALVPILARYRCRLGTVQEIVDGRPGPVRVVVMALD